jgi:hypothetical protein
MADGQERVLRGYEDSSYAGFGITSGILHLASH